VSLTIVINPAEIFQLVNATGHKSINRVNINCGEFTGSVNNTSNKGISGVKDISGKLIAVVDTGD